MLRLAASCELASDELLQLMHFVCLTLLGYSYTTHAAVISRTSEKMRNQSRNDRRIGHVGCGRRECGTTRVVRPNTPAIYIIIIL